MEASTGPTARAVMSVWLDLSVPSGHFQSALVTFGTQVPKLSLPLWTAGLKNRQMLKGCPPCSVLACGGGSRILNH